MASELKRLIEQVSREKGIDRQTLIQTLEEAIKSAIRKKYGSKLDLDVTFNEEYGEIEAFQFKEVVEEVIDPEKQVLLSEALKLDGESEIGDELGIKMDTETLGRIAAQSAKQVIIQKMKDAEREVVYDEFKSRKGEVVNGLVQRVDRGAILVNIGQAEAILPQKEQIPREVFRQGDRIRTFILDVKKISKGPQIVLSRTHPHFLIALFHSEVPEISEGIVSIISAAREPGSRAKIAVISKDSDVDPVGACVGMKGTRVQNVVQELRGEKIDIIPWNMDPAKFVVNGLAPAIISKVIVDQANRSMEVIVPDDQLSLAIGKRGQNVRLASKLTNWRIDVKSESRYERQKQVGYQSLLQIPGLSSEMADKLYESGIGSLEEFLETSMVELEDTTRLSVSTLEMMRGEAQRLLQRDETDGGEGSEEEAESQPEIRADSDQLEDVEQGVGESSEEEAESQLEIQADSDQLEDVEQGVGESSEEEAESQLEIQADSDQPEDVEQGGGEGSEEEAESQPEIRADSDQLEDVEQSVGEGSEEEAESQPEIQADSDRLQEG